MQLGQLVIQRSELRSIVTRQLVGERTIDIFTAIRKSNNGQNEQGGIIPFILGSGAKLVGFLIKGILDSAGFILGELVRWFANSLLFLYNFDWNQTDRELNEQIEANNQLIVAAAGSAAAASTVWLVTIGLAGVAALKFPVVAGHVLIRVAEEGGEEIRGAILGVLNAFKDAQAENSFLSSILTARRMKLLASPDPKAKGEPWTISDRLDKRIEGMPKGNARTFWQAYKARFEDDFFSALYVVSYGIEEGFAAAKAANSLKQGGERLVELTPDASIPEEKLFLLGGTEEIKSQTTNTLANYQLIKNREVGQIVGIPLPDYIRANPYVRKAQITFKSKPEPPYRRYGGEEQVTQAIYSVPDLKQGITWEELKTACRAFNWGKYRATANLSNGRQMACYGATGDEAEELLRRLHTLSTASILSLSVTEEKDRDPKRRKKTTRMYPAYAAVTVRRTDLDDPQLVTLDGKGYSSSTQRIDIWRSTKPDDFEPIV